MTGEDGRFGGSTERKRGKNTQCRKWRVSTPLAQFLEIRHSHGSCSHPRLPLSPFLLIRCPNPSHAVYREEKAAKRGIQLFDRRMPLFSLLSVPFCDYHFSYLISLSLFIEQPEARTTPFPRLPDKLDQVNACTQKT